jgi:leader peptidase (prepilin peptidase) / N-methyltransferase
MSPISVVERLAVWRERPLAVCAIAAAAIAACVASLIAAPGLAGFLGAALALIAIAIAVIDARWFIIPNELSAAAFALGLVHAAVSEPPVLQAVFFAALRGAVVAFLFLALRVGYRRLRGRDGIGLGDVKLSAATGVWLSWLAIPIAIEIAALAAIAVFAVRHYAAGRPLDTALKFPFGMFLAPSIWLAWIVDATLLSVAN